MNYELDKRLKDAGFPQEGVREPFCTECKEPAGYVKDFGHKKEYVKVPSLSELIAACGEEFYDLTRAIDGTFHAMSWGEDRTDLGGGKCEPGCCGKVGKGATPEEAVAHLWLALRGDAKKTE